MPALLHRDSRAIGHGASSKPSDGMRAAFPRYDYDDLADAQYRLLTERFGVRHLRAVIGNSMGGMETWLLAEQHPVLYRRRGADGLAAGRDVRSQMLRRLITDSIRNDPEWNLGVHQAVEERAVRDGVLRARDQRRQPGALQARPRSRRPMRSSINAWPRRSPPTRTTCCIMGTSVDLRSCRSAARTSMRWSSRSTRPTTNANPPREDARTCEIGEWRACGNAGRRVQARPT